MSERRCCPVWAIIMAILVLAAIAVFVFMIVKKMHMLSSQVIPVNDDTATEAEGGVRYTTDQDFV